MTYVIVTSTRVEASVQIDGRTAVREHHTTADGAYGEVAYLAPAGADLDALLLANAKLFLAYLAGA